MRSTLLVLDDCCSRAKDAVDSRRFLVALLARSGFIFLLAFWAGVVLWRDRAVLLLGGWFEGAFYFCNFFLGVTFFVLLGFSRKFLSWLEE